MPKGVPPEPGEQRLAVHVEDHPLEYGTFEGEIPAGQLRRAGTMRDLGLRHVRAGRGQAATVGLTFRLHGERLTGLYALVPAKLGGDPKNWLLLAS